MEAQNTMQTPEVAQCNGPVSTPVTYAISPARVDQISNIFKYHAPKDGQAAKYEALRSHAKELALLIVGLTPESREQSLALTKLEEAIFFANAAIARHE